MKELWLQNGLKLDCILLVNTSKVNWYNWSTQWAPELILLQVYAHPWSSHPEALAQFQKGELASENIGCNPWCNLALNHHV